MLKSATSLAVIVCVLSSSPLAAQQLDAGPIHRFIALESSRVTLAPSRKVDSKWRAVLAVERGKHVVVQVRDGRMLRGYGSAADDSTLMLVNFDGAAIPPKRCGRSSGPPRISRPVLPTP
jgi:hypothetical protein